MGLTSNLYFTSSLSLWEVKKTSDQHTVMKQGEQRSQSVDGRKLQFGLKRATGIITQFKNVDSEEGDSRGPPFRRQTKDVSGGGLSCSQPLPTGSDASHMFRGVAQNRRHPALQLTGDGVLDSDWRNRHRSSPRRCVISLFKKMKNSISCVSAGHIICRRCRRSCWQQRLVVSCCSLCVNREQH